MSTNFLLLLFSNYRELTKIAIQEFLFYKSGKNTYFTYKNVTNQAKKPSGPHIVS